MPRIYNGDSEPIDFCRKCFPSEDEAIEEYGEGEGPDGRGNCFGYDCAHPPYWDTDYVCEKCEEPLTDLDD